MSAVPKSAAIIVLRGLAWAFFAGAGLSFWVGGRSIAEFAHTDRLLAEMEGFGLTLLFAALGSVAKTMAERIAESNEGHPPSGI